MKELSPKLNELINLFTIQKDAIDAWFVDEFAKHQPPFYASVDIRISIDKIAPIDLNLFPGGFNNLNESMIKNGAAAVRSLLAQLAPEGGKVLVIAELHTRNKFYADNLANLGKMLQVGGTDVRFASFSDQACTLEGTENTVEVGLLTRTGNQVTSNGFVPELLLLNNDLSSGTPEILQGITQRQLPPLAAGWSTRRKSSYFFQYERVAARFARQFGFEKWLIDAYFNVCSKVDISRKIGISCLASAVEETLTDIQNNYKQSNSKDQPFVVLKTDAGTYGMGVIMVSEADQVYSLNRRQRANLSTGKDGLAVSDILIQEGVPTIENCSGAAAETAFYCVGNQIIGGFWRFNPEKSDRENLNSKGMQFMPLTQPEPSQQPLRATANVIARLSLLAAAREFATELTFQQT